MSQPRIALVTGANRGIGLATAKALADQGDTVILGCRELQKAEDARESLGRRKGTLVACKIDVSNEQSVSEAIEHLCSRFGRVDVLVNNAGILADASRNPPDPKGASIFDISLDVIRSSFETNTFGALRLIRALVPGMKTRGYGRIVNVSSGMGQLEDMNGGWPGYRLSKLALNGVTRIVADELVNTGILVNSVCPGWVKTAMGGADADLTPEEGADTIVWLASLPDGSPSGRFFRERQEIPW